MTNETNPGTVEPLADRMRRYINVATRLGNRTDDPNNAVFMMEEALAAQSQPAATVQEVPWHGERPEQVCEAIAQFWSEWEEDRAGSGVYSQEELAETAGEFATDLFDRLAALTAEPAAKAGDVERLVVAARRVLEAEDWANKGGERRSRMRSLDQAVEAFSVAIPYEGEPTPSPQPDMGSGEAVERIARMLCEQDGCDPDDHVIAGQAAAFEDYGPCWQAMQRSEGQCGGRDYVEDAQAILAALSSPASQSVEKLIRAAQRVLDRGYVSEHIEEERADHLALKEALAALPHKEEATPATTERGRG